MAVGRTDRLAVDKRDTFRKRTESANAVEECAFPTTRWSDDAKNFTREHVEIDVVQHTARYASLRVHKTYADSAKTDCRHRSHRRCRDSGSGVHEKAQRFRQRLRR